MCENSGDQIRNLIFGVSCPFGRGDGCASKYTKHADFLRKTEVPSQDLKPRKRPVFENDCLNVPSKCRSRD